MNRTASESVGIAIFARAPIPGQAKTRLIPLIGAEKAAALQAQLTERAVATALRADVGPVTLWCAPDTTHPSFQEIAHRSRISLHVQPDSDLGARMAHAFEILTPNHPLLLMGTDCPVMTDLHLIQCAQAVKNHDLVFLPVEDGGYCLIGAKKLHPTLFEAMPWGTDKVMALTRMRAAAIGLSLAEPALLWDLDRPEDYARAVAAGLLEG